MLIGWYFYITNTLDLIQLTFFDVNAKLFSEI